MKKLTAMILMLAMLLSTAALAEGLFPASVRRSLCLRLRRIFWSA